jgi:hypothetical protein
LLSLKNLPCAAHGLKRMLALAGQHSNFSYGNKLDYLLEKKDDNILV